MILFQNKAFAKALTIASLLRTKFKENVSVLFAFFALTASLVLLLSGVLYLERLNADPYEAIADSSFRIALVVIPWIAAGVAFTVLVLKLRKNKRVSNENAVLFAVSLCQIIFFALMTYLTCTFVPRHHDQEELSSLNKWMEQSNKILSLNINDYVSEGKVFFRGRMLLVQHPIKNVATQDWRIEILRPQLLPQACDLFAHYAVYKTIQRVIYTFSADKQKITILFVPGDCNKTGTIPSPTLDAPQQNATP